VGGSGNRVARCYIHDNDHGVYMSGSGNILGPDNVLDSNGDRGVRLNGANIVEFNRIRGHTSDGIFLEGSADGSVVQGNTVYQNGNNGIYVSGLADNVAVLHNTVHGNTGNGVGMGNNIEGTDLRNNIFSQNGGWGVDGEEDKFAIHDYNVFYLNASGTCSGCSGLGANSMTDDPLFVDPAGYDLRLRDDSPLIDQAVVIPGLDLNRAEPGDYNGSGPDIGAWEAP
jgi:parallel beta-helix repeat protein